MLFVVHYRVIAVTFWAIKLSQRLFAYNLFIRNCIHYIDSLTGGAYAGVHPQPPA